MFTVEIKINGTLINHIYGHNEGPAKGGKFQEDKYRYELYQVETKGVRNGTVTHYRPDGINALVVAILQDAETKKGK